MFPAAFLQDSHMPTDDIEQQAALANDQHEAEDIDGSCFAPNSPVSQGYASRGNDSIHSDDSNDSVELEIQLEKGSPEFRIEEIKAEYSQYDAVDNNDLISRSYTFEQTRTEPSNSDKTAQKQKRSNSDAIKEPVAKRLVRDSDRHAQTNREIILIDDEQDTETPSTSSQNHDEQNASKNDENFKLLLDEFSEISGKIALYEEKKKEIMKKLEKWKK